MIGILANLSNLNNLLERERSKEKGKIKEGEIVGGGESWEAVHRWEVSE